jgi:outer membrane cobalamin receptor
MGRPCRPVVRGAFCRTAVAAVALLALAAGAARASEADGGTDGLAIDDAVGDGSAGDGVPSNIAPSAPPMPAEVAESAAVPVPAPSLPVGRAEVFVAGDRSAAELRRSPYPVTVVDVKRYAGRAMNLAELLDRTAGVKIRQSGGVGSASRVSIRGLEGRRVAIFLDGHPLYAPDGNFGINDLPLQLIDRVEIYKGAVPARLGGDGLGSAINVVLRDRSRSYADTGYTYGSYDVQRGWVFGKYVDPVRGIRVGAGVIANYASNDYLMPRPGRTPVRRDHDRFQNVLAGASVELTKTWLTKAKLELGFVANRKEYQGIPVASSSGGGQFNVREARTVSQTYFVGLELEKRDAVPGLDLSYDLLFPTFHSNFRDLATTVYDFDGNPLPNPNGSGEVGRGPNDTNNWRVDVRHRLNASYALGSHHSLNLLSDVARTFDRPSDPAANAAAGVNITPYPGDLLRSVTSLSHEGHFLGDRVIEVVGLKYFYLWSSGTLSSLYDTVTSTPEKVEQQKGEPGWNLALRYRLVDSLFLKASYEHSARLPSAEELFGDGFRIQGSTRLSPEIADNVTAGIYLDVNRDGRRLLLDVSAFASRVHDLIVLGGAFTPNYANVGAAKIQGLEVDLKADLTSFLYVYGNLTWQDLRNDAAFVPGTMQANYLRGLVIPNVPRLFANWGAELYGPSPIGREGRFKVFYDASFTERYYYEYQVSANQSRLLPRYLVNTLGLQHTFADGRYSVNLEANNLADVRRYDDFNVPLPGRTFRVLFRATFL